MLNYPTDFSESSFMFSNVQKHVLQLLISHERKFVHEMLLNWCVCDGKVGLELPTSPCCKYYSLPTDLDIPQIFSILRISIFPDSLCSCLHIKTDKFPVSM